MNPSLSHAIMRPAAVLRRRLEDGLHASLKITSAPFRALDAIHERPGIGSVALGRQWLIAPQSASSVVSTLLRAGCVRHLVLLRFADHVTQSERNAAIERLLGLKETCLRDDGKPYILSIETGTQCSGEGANAGFEHAFLMTFASEGDRNFYTGEPVITDPLYYDPTHHVFKWFIGPMLAGALVFDYAVDPIPDGS